MKRFYKFLMPLVAIVALALPWNARAQVTVTIGSGTATNSYLPTYEFYNYSLSQQIYTAEEIDMVGTINSISFYTGGSATRTLAIYMVNTTKTSFSGPTDWIVPTANDQVFSGSVTYVANGWTTITLTTPFVYDGSNLAVIVDDNTGSYVSSIAKRVFTPTASGNCALRIYSDGTNCFGSLELQRHHKDSEEPDSTRDYSRQHQLLERKKPHRFRHRPLELHPFLA